MYGHKREVFLAILFELTLLLLMPWLLAFLLAVNILMTMVVLAVQIRAGMLPIFISSRKRWKHEPFVSIHIPIHNEPPHMLERTLIALSHLDYDNYEVLVLDNNTKDETLWQPVGRICESLGEKFRFYHREDVTGFKAGALDILLGLTSRRAKFIAVIDSDYAVKPGFLKEAVSYFDDSRVALVQFPQAYVNTGKSNIGMMRELEHFFLFYMNMANHTNTVTSTGTMSIYRKRALNKVGGWSSRSITEDCEIGIRLILSGFKTKYVGKDMGSGLMPHDLDSFRKQRDRWIFGNMQLIKRYMLRIMGSPRIGIMQKVSLFTQLTAWTNGLFFPMASIIAASLIYILQPSEAYRVVASLSALSIITYVAGKLMAFVIGFLNKGIGWEDAVKAFMTHLGLLVEGATSWIACIINPVFAFRRTSKFITKTADEIEYNVGIGMVCLAAATFFASRGMYLASTGSLFCALSLATVLYLKKQLIFTRMKTMKLFESQDAKRRKGGQIMQEIALPAFTSSS